MFRCWWPRRGGEDSKTDKYSAIWHHATVRNSWRYADDIYGIAQLVDLEVSVKNGISRAGEQ